MPSYEDIKLVTEIVGEVLIEDKLINEQKSSVYNAYEFTFKIMPILPYVKWELKDDAVEFKSHVKTLFRNKMKHEKIKVESEEQ